MKFIHNKNIIHRDLKPENIFLDIENKVKLGDFGISKILENKNDFANTEIGTPFYLSPEICKGEKYNYKTDIWNIGCIVYELINLKRPFSSTAINELINQIIYNEPEPLSLEYSLELRNLTMQMLNKDAKNRPEIDNLIELNKACLKQSRSSIDNPNSIANRFKLKIEVEDIDSPIHCYKEVKFNSKLFLENEENKEKKSTPSYGRQDIDKVLKNMKISPINPRLIEEKEFSFARYNNKNKSISRKHSNHSSSTSNTQSDQIYNNVNNNERSNKIKSLTGKKGHFRHVSINISSVQSPEHKAIYKIDKIEKISNVEFKKPEIPKSNEFKKITLTPTNLPSSKLNSNLSLKEVPNSTKFSNNRYDRNKSTYHGKQNVKELLIQKFGKDKFDAVMEIIEKDKKTNLESVVKDIIGNKDFKLATSYFSYYIC